MIYSNSRKLCLSGWLQKNDIASYQSSLRLQKFLFLYEVFSKINNDNPDFSRLKGYKRGPVFSPVWGDYTKERPEFDRKSLEAYNANIVIIDNLRAKRSSFIISSLSERELSNLTHRFNIWGAKEKRIMSGELQVELSESDFNESDNNLGRTLELMYPDEIIESCVTIEIGGTYFVFSKEDSEHLKEQHVDTMAYLAEHNELHSPVYVEIDSEGRLCID